MKTKTTKTNKNSKKSYSSSTMKCIREKRNGKEPGCRACGNPTYPDCKYSCPMFDE